MKTYCSRFLHWPGWKKIFPLPLWADVLMFAALGAGLIWVFLNGLELWWPAYFLYGISAYSTISLSVKVPAAILRKRSMRRQQSNSPDAAVNSERKFSRKLYIKQTINFTYGIFKIVYGLIVGSAWIGADGIYNFTQALIQLFQILRRRNPGTMEKQWKSYRICGVLILLMHLTLIGIVFQMVNWNRAKDAGEVMIIITATFAFYKFITSYFKLAKDRKHRHPIDSSVRMLELSQAHFAIFSLQTGLLHTFGTGEAWEHWLNLAVGCMVCLQTVAIGLYMILRANRELKTLQENEHGAARF